MHQVMKPLCKRPEAMGFSLSFCDLKTTVSLTVAAIIGNEKSSLMSRPTLADYGLESRAAKLFDCFEKVAG